MDHTLCLNTNSFPAESEQEATLLFDDALQGILELNTGNDRYTLYLDSHQSSGLDDFCLADGFTFKDYSDFLLNNQEMDLYLFLLELEDKSPALEYLEDELIDEICDTSFYMPNQPVLVYPDVLSLAYAIDATLLSINTSEQWSSSNVFIAKSGDGGRYINEQLSLNNISTIEHGKKLFEQFQHVNLHDICKSTELASAFIGWYEDQSQENKIRIVEKYRLACERNFEGGEPLFKTLDSGLREVRFSAYPGGATRLLFKRMTNGKQLVLLGFIKKSNLDGYAENIPKAISLFNELNSDAP